MIKWLAMVLNVAGAFTVAFGIMLAGYAAFLVGSALWFIIGIYTNDKPLVIQSAVFGVANVIGLYNNWVV